MYTLEFEKTALKDFKRVNKADVKFLRDSIEQFVKNFSTAYESELMRTQRIKKLQGVGEEIYRLKLRSYRVIYKKEDERLIILVVSVKSRENSYKK